MAFLGQKILLKVRRRKRMRTPAWYKQLSEIVNLLANRTLPEAAVPVDSEIGFEVKALKVFAVVASRRQRDPLARDRTSGDKQKSVYYKAMLQIKIERNLLTSQTC